MRPPPRLSASRSLPVRLARALLRAVATAAVLVYDALAAVFGPLLRPIWLSLSRLRLFQRIGDWIGRQPPYLVLLLLAVPFILIEPAKVAAVVWASLGHPLQGAVLLAVAEVLSVLVCERIFHAGYVPLMRIGWFSRLIGWLIGLRDRALGWLRDTALWRDVRRWARAVRLAWLSLRRPRR